MVCWHERVGSSVRSCERHRKPGPRKPNRVPCSVLRRGFNPAVYGQILANPDEAGRSGAVSIGYAGHRIGRNLLTQSRRHKSHHHGKCKKQNQRNSAKCVLVSSNLACVYREICIHHFHFLSFEYFSFLLFFYLNESVSFCLSAVKRKRKP